MKQEFGYFLKNAKFRAALGLTLLLSYGYAIATTRVSIDSLEGDRYIGTGGVMLSTGRFGMNLWAAVLGYGRAEPSYAFGIDLLAALLLALAAVSFCALLRKAAQDRISMFGYGLFACLFVSYPLMNEIWEYSGANVCVCGGYLLDAAALNLLWDARQPGVPWRGRALRMGAAALCLMVVCSSYESLAAVYVLAVFALLTLEQLLAAERPRLAAVLTEGLWYAAALVCLHQAMYLNHLLAVDYQRSEQEAAVVRTLGNELVRDYGTDKPVVLVGRYTLGENITRYTTADPMQHPLYRFFREHTSWESGDTVKYVETNCNSVLNWSVTAFSEVDDVYGQAAEHLFRYYGFALDMTHSAALHEQAQTYADAHDLPGYPRAGAIVDCGDYVLVNLQ